MSNSTSRPALIAASTGALGRAIEVAEHMGMLQHLTPIGDHGLERRLFDEMVVIPVHLTRGAVARVVALTEKLKVGIPLHQPARTAWTLPAPEGEERMINSPRRGVAGPWALLQVLNLLAHLIDDHLEVKTRSCVSSVSDWIWNTECIGLAVKLLHQEVELAAHRGPLARQKGARSTDMRATSRSISSETCHL